MLSPQQKPQTKEPKQQSKKLTKLGLRGRNPERLPLARWFALTVCLLLSLTACAGSAQIVGVNEPLPEPPQELKDCAAAHLANLPRGKWSIATTGSVVARLVQSEEYKDDCAKRWQSFYGGVKRTRDTGPKSRT